MSKKIFLTITFLSLLFFFLGCEKKIETKEEIQVQKEEPPVQKEEVITVKETKLVTDVIDGDTITIQGGESVRLIGMDADDKEGPCYEEAKKRLAELILHKTVELEKDVSDRDQYQRLLRYIWFEGKNMSVEMVREGLAIAKTYPPNTKYQEEIAKAEEEAIKNKAGCKWREEEVKTQTETVTPPPSTTPTAPVPVTTSTQPSTPSTTGFTCGSKKTCGQMTSCAEAKFYLNNCGVSSLDRDKDGIPCEDLCK